MKISFLILVLAIPVLVPAQTDEQKASVLRAAGDTAGPALLTTYEAVNALGEGWKNKTFAADRALELAGNPAERAYLGRLRGEVG